MKLIEWEHTSTESAKRIKLSLDELRTTIEELIEHTVKMEELKQKYTELQDALNKFGPHKPYAQPDPIVLPPKPDGAGFKVLSIVTLVWGFSFAIFIPITMTKNSLSSIPAPLLTAIVIIGLAIALIPQLFIIPGKRKSLKQQIQRWEEECAAMQQDYQQKMNAWKTNVEWCEKENKLLPQKRRELANKVNEAKDIYEDARAIVSSYGHLWGFHYLDRDDNKYYLYSAETLVNAYSFIQKGYADTWESALEYYRQEYESKMMKKMSFDEQLSFIYAKEEFFNQLNNGNYVNQEEVLYRYEQQRLAAEQKKQMELELARAHDAQAKQQEELERIRKDLDNIDLLQTLAYIERTKNNS